jgi:hypothetical protein
MSLRGLLRHQLAIVTPSAADLSDLDESGFPVATAPSITLVPGLVQPRDSHETKQPFSEGVVATEFIIFLEVIELSAASYITDADDAGPVEGGRRFQIDGIQPFLYGRDPHLEVMATLIAGTVALADYMPGS